MTLAIRGLTVALPRGADRPHAVEGIDLEVNAGEIVCLVGGSGSGKSVTGYTVMGLLPKGLHPVAGEIRLDGENLLAATPHQMRALRGTRLSMIFQDSMTALNPTTTAGAQVAEMFAIHGTLPKAQREQRVLSLLQAMHLPNPEELRRAYPHQLSGGQRQRVMIAMALALEPRLLIADEPTTALDVTTQAQILSLIDELRRTHGTAVLFITHDFGVVAEIADRVAVMHQGRIVEAGPVQAVLRAPQHPYTQELIEAVPTLSVAKRAPIEQTLPVLAVERLSKHYAGGWPIRRRQVDAVVDATLDVRRGETLGLIGESGSGKSTLARCIARLVMPSAGIVRIDGEDVETLSRRMLRRQRQLVQIIFQDPYRSLNPRRRVLESLIEGPLNYGVARSEAIAKVRDLVGIVGLDPATLSRYPHAFSGGQRQRLAIARALAVGPELMIADEAVSALDVSVQARVLDLLEDVQRRFNLAMLFITHDLRVAARICDRVAVMQRGRIVEIAPTAELFAEPQHDYTRALLAAAPGRRFDWRATT